MRNFIFGVEDSLVSTVGFVSGIAASSVDRSTLLLSGTVLIFVEAFSMGVGSALSEESVQESRTRRAVQWGAAIGGGLVMFVSYILAGFFVLFPYIINDTSSALPQSVAVSLALLFLLGIFSAHLTRRPLIGHGLRMLIVGGLAVMLGIVVGQLLS